MTAFQTFFDQVKDESLESKELAEFTRLVLGGTAITSRNEANAIELSSPHRWRPLGTA